MAVMLSVSRRVVSSNPGVSIRITLWSSRENGLDSNTSDVQLFNPPLTDRVDPLTRLMNCNNPVLSKQMGRRIESRASMEVHTVDLPLPVVPITLDAMLIKCPYRRTETHIQNSGRCSLEGHIARNLGTGEGIN